MSDSSVDSRHDSVCRKVAEDLAAISWNSPRVTHRQGPAGPAGTAAPWYEKVRSDGEGQMLCNAQEPTRSLMALTRVQTRSFSRGDPWCDDNARHKQQDNRPPDRR